MERFRSEDGERYLGCSRILEGSWQPWLSAPLGQMTLGEGVIIDGSGSQLVSARWGDYTSMNIDPTDDCTFWYVNEYYQTSSAGGWQTRIGSFRLRGC